MEYWKVGIMGEASTVKAFFQNSIIPSFQAFREAGKCFPLIAKRSA
jgi:hypothetical protein